MELAGHVIEQWSAPKASDGEKGGPNQRGSKGDVPLPGQAANWNTPLVADAGEKVTLTAHQDSLLAQAAMWPGPAAGNFNDGEDLASFDARKARQKEKHNNGNGMGDSLAIAAARTCASLPPSSPDRPIAGGSMSSTAGPNSNQPSAKRKLNPIFVEALMRWPTGLSGFARQETAWTRWWQLQLSYLSARVSASGTESRQGSLF